MSEWFDGVDGIASGACGVAIFSTASALDDVVRSLGGLTPSSG